MSYYYLGVDGGQSSTTALIGDESGAVIGRGIAGPCNHATAEEGRRKFTAALTECLAAARGKAGIYADTEFRAACLGFSGGPADKEVLVREMVPAQEMVLEHDGMIALAGATGGRPGVIAIGGTGSIAFGRNAQGKTARAGGWGYVFGDEGGAFDIVRQALRLALRYEEGWGTETALHGALLEATGATNANELMHLFYSDDYPRNRVATMAGTVSQTAKDGDPAAVEVLRAAGRGLAELAAAVRKQLFAAGEDVVVSYVGGVFQDREVLEVFRTQTEMTDGVRCAAPEYGPAEGALLEAFRLGGVESRLNS
jgi:N-acetylglucosamine kinase-like BadF-type ATPase